MINLVRKYRYLNILGDGQVWDVKGISPLAPQETFEGLFSGRALGQMAQTANRQFPGQKGIFSAFKEKGKITGLSVTKALLSNNRKARQEVVVTLGELAGNGALGIETLTCGKGLKENWTERERGYWRNLDRVIIGGGVSEGQTGKILIGFIKKYLSQNGFSAIRVSQAKFPGKEAGFLGGVISILKIIGKEAKEKKLKVIAGIGLDLGREEVGVGLLAVNPQAKIAILKKGKHYWLYKNSLKTASRKDLNIFLDARRDYTAKERAKGKRMRQLILNKMTDLILKAQAKAGHFKLAISRHIAVAVPGSTSKGGYILNSTDYLPFLRKKDGFNFAKTLENLLRQRGLSGYRIHLLNDGIAAGIANIYFNSAQARTGEKFAFLGVGSGLGGCVGKVVAG